MTPGEAAAWLEAMASTAAAGAVAQGRISVPLAAPEGIIAHGARRVTEFYAVLADGTEITTTRVC